jgi:hypothetical protein
MHMSTLLLRLVITAAAGSLIPFYSMLAQESPTTPKAARVRITQGPEIEITNLYLTIIRWTTNNLGGSPVHYGIVHYGTDPKNLSQTAQNPIRLNPYHPDSIFRVRLDDLKPATVSGCCNASGLGFVLEPECIGEIFELISAIHRR